jgi:hypothetical protein
MGVTFDIFPGKRQAEPRIGLVCDAPLSALVAWTERVSMRRGGAWWSGRSPVIGGRPVATLRLPGLPPTLLVWPSALIRLTTSLRRGPRWSALLPVGLIARDTPFKLIDGVRFGF